jgi:hypothetical protein
MQRASTSRIAYKTTQADKAIIRAFYSAAPNIPISRLLARGLRPAEAQRYPRDYDGIIAGDPANY